MGGGKDVSPRRNRTLVRRSPSGDASAFGPAEVEAMLASYGLPADPWRLDFYRLLDEFF